MVLYDFVLLILVCVVVMDFDGVYIDDIVIVDVDGGECVWVSWEDGMGVLLLCCVGILMLILLIEVNFVVCVWVDKFCVFVLYGIDDKEFVLWSWVE